MKCELCGKEFQPSGHGRPQKYCSKSCRQKADYRRKKNRPARDRNGKPPVKAVETKQKPEQDLDQRSFERMMDGSMLDMLRANRLTVPLGRYGNEAETSAGIVFLLSPAASFISGTVLRIDGARPQVRQGWGDYTASTEVQQRDAIKLFDGFHHYVTPQVFQS